MAAHMERGNFLTPTQARSMFKAQKPSARIRELRLEGVEIVSTKNKGGKFAWAVGTN